MNAHITDEPKDTKQAKNTIENLVLYVRDLWEKIQHIETRAKQQLNPNQVEALKIPPCDIPQWTFGNTQWVGSSVLSPQPVPKKVFDEAYAIREGFMNDPQKEQSLLPAEQILKRMSDLKSSRDHESTHVKGDDLLCAMLIQLGQQDLVEEWNKLEKWYT